MNPRVLLIITLCLLGLTAAGISLRYGNESASVPAATEAGADIGGAFSLLDQNGKLRKESDFRGRLMLVYFGFTHCPHICPMALGQLTALMDSLGPKTSQVVPVFISVDPERDHPARMKEFLADFSPAIVGLTGTPQQVDAAAKAYKAYFEAETPKGAKNKDYNVNHSGFIYVMGKDGKYLTHFSSDADAAAMKAALAPYLP